MRKFFYRKTTGDIIFSDTLEVAKLNSVAQQIFEAIQAGHSQDQIASALASQYQIDINETQQDVKDTLSRFQELGVLQTPTEWPLQLHTVIMHIIQNCNSPCKLCDCWQTKQKTLHTLEQLRPTIHWLKQSMQNQNVMVSGGEPLLHPEIQQIAREIKQNQMHVLLNTNGLLLHRHNWIDSQTVDEVVVSMDGYDAVSYKTVRGLDGYARVWSNIADLKRKDSKLRVSLRLILNSVNINQVTEILRQAKLGGIDRVGVSPLDITNLTFGRKQVNIDQTAQWSQQFLPSETQMREFHHDLFHSEDLKEYISEGLCDWSIEDFERCLDYYRVLRSGRQVNFSNELCLFPTNSLVIDYDGGIKPCFYQPAIASLEAPEQYTKQYSSALQKTVAEGRCKSCRGKVFCDVQI